MISVTSFFPLIPSLFSVYIFAYVRGQRRHTPVHSAFLLYAGSVAFTHFLEFLTFIPLGPPYHTIAMKMTSFSFFLLPFFFLNFIYSAIGRKRDALFITLAIAGIVVAFLSLIIDHKATTTIFDEYSIVTIPKLLLIPLVLTGGFLPIVYSIYLLLKTIWVTTLKRERKKLHWVLAGTFSGILITSFTLFIFPLSFNMPEAAQFSWLGTLAMLVMIYYAIAKHHFLTINIEQIESVSRKLFENASDCIVLFDAEGICVQVNEASERLFGKNEELLNSQDLESIIEGYSFKKTYNDFITNCKTNDSRRIIALSQFSVNESDVSLGKLMIARDITDQKQMEQELNNTRHFESLSLLAGGIAHDFNNFLTGILGNFSVLKYEKSLAENLQSIVEVGEKAALKASHLVNQLLTFSKGGVPVQEPQSVTELIKETMSFVLRGSNVSLTLELPDDLKPVSVDKSQISQVLQNLALNAVQAMPTGGEIRIKGCNRTISGNNLLPLAEGEYVEIVFKDTGVGIPGDKLNRIFDPYFSLKPNGKGLGLSIVYSIVKKHGGYISVISKTNQGTTFTLLLPQAQKQPVKKDPKTANRKKSFGGGKILIIDDEEVVAMTLARILEDTGFIVDTAHTGEEALALYHREKKDNGSYRAVITDLTVPGAMGGKELTKKLLEDNPQLKIIVTSGYSTDPVIARYADFGFCGAIKKPYTVDNVRDVLESVLGN